MKQLIKSVTPKWIKNIYRSYKIKTSKGDDVYCPICNSSFKIFGIYGLRRRTNAKCHNCNSLERHRLLYLYLTETNNIFDESIEPTRLLHFSPEKIFYEKLDNNNKISYTTCDLFPEGYNFKGKTEVQKVDITKMPYEDNSFDFILCNHVLEHIPDDNLAMTELYRVLSDNGEGIFQVPIDYSREETYEDWSITSPKDREKAFGQNDHVRWYGQDYKVRLEKVGFTVNEIDYTSKFSSEDIFKYGLDKTEKIYHCKK